MRWIAKALLFLVTVALPVFIAACYGAPRSYARDDKANGPKPVKIIDEQTDPAGQDQGAKEKDKAADKKDEAAEDGQDGQEKPAGDGQD